MELSEEKLEKLSLLIYDRLVMLLNQYLDNIVNDSNFRYEILKRLNLTTEEYNYLTNIWNNVWDNDIDEDIYFSFIEEIVNKIMMKIEKY